MIKGSKTIELIIRELIKNRIRNRADLDSFKRKVAKKYKIPCPNNVELLKTYHKLAKNKRVKKNETIEKLLRTRPIRSLSGIVNVSVLTKPYPCPGKCIYCPEEKGIPKSYLKEEPAVQRAILNKFDPYKQVQTRLKSLEQTGHPIDKIELRIIGGTWSYYPKQYQNWFITRCFAACNAELRGTIRRTTRKIKSLKKEQRLNEKAKCRIVGVTVETRPDYTDIAEIKRMRELGITRVELGVQSIYDDVLKLVKRGHNVRATIGATKLLKDAGFKVSYQMMPNLPGSTLEKDIEMFKELFSNPDFQPDLLKIYPLALVKKAPLYQWYQKGKYKPYSKKELIKLLVEIKKQIPYWVRVQRIVRDIPSKDIVEGGVKISNLREVARKEMQQRRLKCKCIRCREVRENYDPKDKLYLFREDYESSGEREIFLSFEAVEADKRRLSTLINVERKLYALLRLRIPSGTGEGQVRDRSTPVPEALQSPEARPPEILPVLRSAAIIREVHTYGQMLPVGEKTLAPQHQGLGKKLIKQAEKIAKKEFNLKKNAVISAIGTRDYYRKLGYRLKDTYMVKKI